MSCETVISLHHHGPRQSASRILLKLGDIQCVDSQLCRQQKYPSVVRYNVLLNRHLVLLSECAQSSSVHDKWTTNLVALSNFTNNFSSRRINCWECLAIDCVDPFIVDEDLNQSASTHVHTHTSIETTVQRSDKHFRHQPQTHGFIWCNTLAAFKGWVAKYCNKSVQ